MSISVERVEKLAKRRPTNTLARGIPHWFVEWKTDERRGLEQPRPRHKERLDEHYSDPAFLAPDNAAVKLLAIRRHKQREVFRNAHWAGDIKSSTRLRQVTNGTVYRTATKDDFSDFQHSVTRRDPFFLHPALSRVIFAATEAGKLGL
jgi:hypothetical protein